MTNQPLTPAESLQASVQTLEELAETREQIFISQAEVARLNSLLSYKQPALDLAQQVIPYGVVLNARISTYPELISQVGQIVQLKNSETLEAFILLEEYIYPILADLFELLFYLRKDFIQNNNQFQSLLNSSGQLRANLTNCQPLIQVNAEIVINDIKLFVKTQDNNSISVVSLIFYLFVNQRIQSSYDHLINQLGITYYFIPELIDLDNLITESNELFSELIQLSGTNFDSNNYILRIEDIMTILYPYTAGWESSIIQNSPPLMLNSVLESAIEKQATRLDIIERFYALVNELIPGMDAQLDYAYNQVALAIAYTI
jgi:hypothetical protein